MFDKVVITAIMSIGIMATSSMASEKQLRCLQANIYWEARNQDELGQTLVAWVTLNRVQDKRWPNTICQVVYQPSQFSWTLDEKKRWSGADSKEKPQWQTAKQIAQQAITDKKQNKSDPSHGSTYFHTKQVNPSWAKRFSHTLTHGNHIFYR